MHNPTMVGPPQYEHTSSVAATSVRFDVAVTLDSVVWMRHVHVGSTHEHG
jgi:hypothetical protein